MSRRIRVEMAKREKQTHSTYVKPVVGRQAFESPTNTAQLHFSYWGKRNFLTRMMQCGLICGLRNTLLCRVVAYEGWSLVLNVVTTNSQQRREKVSSFLQVSEKNVNRQCHS
ncbi:hypothetical protein HO173_003523 [Letharia columbiana]|uniref:Uncharacterized protein n=1 Tax=Letharia columbiana TaxID=112416 RepID=A0A8H6G0G5_9LECA|nr:uncharacterized protein HO173_003523 [Letharia columbiana]KAF6238243.1 hypothetical protein HO173_003523 [Letharia columbiana]